MRVLKDKKGAELSMNVIVISILVILVLVIVATFFVGGFNNLVKIFTDTAPDDLESAIQSCEGHCLRISIGTATDNAKKKSSYCRNTWNFDRDGDGKLDSIDGKKKEFHCWGEPIGTDCPGVENHCLKK